MIEINLADISRILIQHLEILAAVRCMCSQHATPVDWICQWENNVGKVLKDVRLAKDAKGEILILKD